MGTKIYEIVVSFLEPTQAMITIAADSEEDAINKVRAELDGQVNDLTINSIKEAVELPPGVEAADLTTEKTIN